MMIKFKIDEIYVKKKTERIEILCRIITEEGRKASILLKNIFGNIDEENIAKEVSNIKRKYKFSPLNDYQATREEISALLKKQCDVVYNLINERAPNSLLLDRILNRNK